MRASREQFRRVRDRFRLEVAGISIVLSVWAKLYSFPPLWMHFSEVAFDCVAEPGMFRIGHRFWLDGAIRRKWTSMIFRWISFVLFAERFPRIDVPRFRAISYPSLTLNACMLQNDTSIQERFQMATEERPRRMRALLFGEALRRHRNRSNSDGLGAIPL